MIRAVIASALLGACTTPIPQPIESTEADRLAVDALRVEWYEHGRGTPECDLDLPIFEFKTNDELRTWCRWTGQPIGACIRENAEIGIMSVYDSPDPERTRAHNLIHEHIHALRACWVAEDPPSRLRAGESEEWCPVVSASDSNHCDFKAWEDIGLSALALWEEWR